jgi:hypothetical protein
MVAHYEVAAAPRKLAKGFCRFLDGHVTFETQCLDQAAATE